MSKNPTVAKAKIDNEVTYLKSLDTNADGRLDKKELEGFVRDRINAARESAMHCSMFMTFAFDNERMVDGATSKDLTPDTLKKAAQKAVAYVTKASETILRSNIGNQAFPNGIEAMPTIGDLKPIGDAVIEKIKRCAAIPLSQR